MFAVALIFVVVSVGCCSLIIADSAEVAVVVGVCACVSVCVVCSCYQLGMGACAGIPVGMGV